MATALCILKHHAPSILFTQLYHATVKLSIGLAFVHFLNVNTLDH